MTPAQRDQKRAERAVKGAQISSEERAAYKAEVRKKLRSMSDAAEEALLEHMPGQHKTGEVGPGPH